MYLKRILTYSILSLVALGGFFGNIHIETPDNQTSNIAISYEGNATYAADPIANSANGATIAKKEETTSSEAVKMYNNMIGAINIALAVLSVMITPIILFVGWLMSPDWTSGDLFGLRAPMYALWVTVSNIVYFIYAILLILIALGTMFGQDKFSYKVMLPKLALGILMVPFTWWFVQWTISISSVVTASVMTIPTDTIIKGDSAWFSKTQSIPIQITVDNTSDKLNETDKMECPTHCITPKQFIESAGGAYGPLIVYGYSIFKFKEIDTLKGGVDIAKAALQIVHTSIVSTIMFAVFGLLTLALAAMLLVRAIKLWMYAIFAPLFTFRFVAGSNLMGGDDDSFTIKEFIGLAFVPAIVGLTLSFGLIMVNAVSGPESAKTTTSSTICKLDDGKGCVIGNIMGNPKNSITRKIVDVADPSSLVKISETTFSYGDIDFIFKGKAVNQTNSDTTGTGALDAVGGMFGTLIVDVIALVFIWMAFMAAKNVSKAVKMAVQPFEDIGSKVGSLAKSIPKYTPLPGLGMSAAGMTKVVTNAENAMIGAHDERFKSSAAGKLFGGDKVVATVDEKKLAEAMKAAGTNPDDKFNLTIVGDQLRKQAGKDIDHSPMFQTVADGLKNIKEPRDKIRTLENIGYSNKTAIEIVEHLAKNSNDINKNDATLMAALKSIIGAPAGGAGSGGGTQSATWKGTNAEIKHDNIEITLNNINQLSDNKAIITALETNGVNLKGKVTIEELKSILGKLFSDPKKVDSIIAGMKTDYVKPATPLPKP